jgi:hypothetical protein
MALHPRQLARILASCAFVLLPVLLALSGCVPTGPTSSELPGAPSATPTAAAATATATPLPTACAQLPAFASASPLALANVEFPAGAVAAAPATSGGDSGEFSLATYSVCVPDNTAALTVASGKGPKPFLTLLLFSGWGPIGTFPDDGRIQTDCGSAKCFSLPDDQRYLAVDQVRTLGSGLVTFRLRHATPPPGPVCDPGAFPDRSYQVASDQGNGVLIPLPPLSRVGQGQGAAEWRQLLATDEGRAHLWLRGHARRRRHQLDAAYLPRAVARKLVCPSLKWRGADISKILRARSWGRCHG